MGEVELPNPHELEEIRQKGFTKRVALITAIFAVVLAIAALGKNYTMKEMLLAQQQASNQWSFYQAKVIREHLYQSQRMILETIQLDRGGSMKQADKGQIEIMLQKMAEEEARYNKEKKEIGQVAKKFETMRDLHRSKDPFFEFAEVLLQIAIVMSSISILASSHKIFYFAFISGILGALLAFNGFMMVFSLPFFH